MIVLKIILYVILAVLGTVLGIVLIALILPIKAKFSLIDGNVEYSVKYSLIPLADSDSNKTLLGWYRKRKRGGKKTRKKSTPKDDEPLVYSEHSAEEISEDTEKSEEKKRSEKIEKIKKKKYRNTQEYGDGSDDFDDFDDDFIFDDDEDSKPEEKSTIGTKVGKLLDVWEQLERPVLKILRGVHLYDVFIDFIVTNPDACKCALMYGSISGTVYNLLAWISEMFTVKFRTVDIQCGFAQKKSRWDTSFKVSFRLIVLVVAGLWFITAYIFRIFLPKKLKGRKTSKSV